MEMIQGTGYFLTGPAQRLQRREFSLPEPSPCEVIIEVAGCGICHTDIGFAHDGVADRKSVV